MATQRQKQQRPLSSNGEESQRQVAASVGIYTPWCLRIYDVVVLWLLNRLAWKCSTSGVLLPLFKSALGKRHLDIGVGTGYFPAHALLEHHDSSEDSCCEMMTLVDLNRNTLHLASRRIRQATSRVQVTTVLADVLSPPLPLAGDVYDSISLFYLLHCLPGPPETKIRAVTDAVAPLLSPGGTVVGATILGTGSRMNWLARALMAFYNWYGIFGNARDSQDVLSAGLKRRFHEVDVWCVGAVMLFRARGPKLDGKEED